MILWGCELSSEFGGGAMSTVLYEDKLMQETGSQQLLNSLMAFALELELYNGVNAQVTIKELVNELKRIKERNGGKLPSYRQTYKLLEPIMDKCMSYRKSTIKPHYIKTQGMYVIMTSPGHYMLTPFKNEASKFPSYKAAERFMRELWIDGKIED